MVELRYINTNLLTYVVQFRVEGFLGESAEYNGSRSLNDTLDIVSGRVSYKGSAKTNLRKLLLACS